MRIIAPELGTFPTAFFRVLFACMGLLTIVLVMRIHWDFRGKLKLCLILGTINSGECSLSTVKRLWNVAA